MKNFIHRKILVCFKSYLLGITNIRIEAADTLELIAGDQIILQSKGRINQTTGAYVSTFDTKKEVGSTKAEIKVPQRIMTSNDPRSSDDIVIAGHVNRRFGGDYRVEAGGISAFGGVHSHQLNNNDDGTINLQDIKNGIRFNKDAHFPKTKLLCLENTHNICYGNPINSEYFVNVKEIIKKHNIKLHIDGARIFNAASALNTKVEKLPSEADSDSFCLSKGLSCPAGSVIVGNTNFIDKARRIRKALGGGMRQAGILASAGIYALNNLTKRLSDDHNNAQKLAEKLNNINGIKINLDYIKTNIIFFYLSDVVKLTDNEFINKLLEKNIKIDSKGNSKFRIVTHLDFNEQDIETVVSAIKSII